MLTIVTDDPHEIAEAIKRGIEEISIKLALGIHSNLTADPRDGGTPVRTGFASASWICSIGEPSSDVGGAPGRPDHNPSDSGKSNLETFKLENGFIFITNNVTYILDLNRGHSPQATSGFIDSAVVRGVTGIEI